MKFIHASDLHLDSPLTGLEQYEGAPIEAIRNTTRQALMNLVNLAITEQVDFVLLAGDIYDSDWRDMNTGMFFISQMARLNKSDIRVFTISGNHDAASRMSKRLPLPNNVKELSSQKPETILINDLKVAIHGQSFATRSVKDNLVKSYPDSEPGFFNIGVLHTSINGREGHDNYAPCTLQDLIDKNYDYWALGHVHKREIVYSGPECWVVFPGNTQGRNIKEDGPKGCSIITVNGTTVEAVEHVDLDVMRWIQVEVDCSGLASLDDILRKALDTIHKNAHSLSKPAAIRLRLIGESPAHYMLASGIANWIEDIRARLVGADWDVWLEKVKIATRHEEQKEYINPVLAAVNQTINEILLDDDSMETMLEDITNFIVSLPADNLDLKDMMNSPDGLKNIFGTTEDYLIGLLSRGIQHED